VAKKAAPPRGATPLQVKEKREWSITLPRIPWRLFGSLALVALLVTGGRWVYHSWPIQDIEINGRLNVWKAEDIAHQLSWVKGESFFSLDPQKVYQQVAGLPLVKQVMVRKKWPGTLQIMVAEDLPMALMNGKKLLSMAGDVSEIPEGYDISQLARINGDETKVAIAVRYFRRVQQSLKQKELKIDLLTINRVGSVSLNLSNGWEVKLGRQYFEERVQRLSTLLSKLPQADVESLDLRYGKGAAVRWRTTQEMG